MFDERFFLYAEEADWQRRASLRGWSVAVCADVVARARSARARAPTRAVARRCSTPAQETYIRKWYGAAGWWLYRVAACAGAAARAVVLRGERRVEAARRLRLYLQGPRRCAALGPEWTDAACRSHRHDVGVRRRRAVRVRRGDGDGRSGLGGRGRRRQTPTECAGALGRDVRWEPGATALEAAESLLRLGRCDISHAHMTIAEAMAVATRPVHRAAIVVARDISRRLAARAGSAASWLRGSRRRVAREIASATFVARQPRAAAAGDRRGLACRRRRACGEAASRVVLVLQTTGAGEGHAHRSARVAGLGTRRRRMVDASGR